MKIFHPALHKEVEIKNPKLVDHEVDKVILTKEKGSDGVTRTVEKKGKEVRTFVEFDIIGKTREWKDAVLHDRFKKANSNILIN